MAIVSSSLWFPILRFSVFDFRVVPWVDRSFVFNDFYVRCAASKTYVEFVAIFRPCTVPRGGVLPHPMREAFPITHVHAYVCTCVRLSVPHAKETWKCKKCLTNYADTTKSNTPMFDCFVQPGLLDVRKKYLVDCLVLPSILDDRLRPSAHNAPPNITSHTTPILPRDDWESYTEYY